MQRRIVITGIGVVTPLGTGLEPFWDAITAGKSGAAEIDRFDTSDYKTKFACQVKDFSVPDEYRRACRTMDLFAQYALFAALEARGDSGIEESEDPARIGVVVGTGMGGLTTIEDQHTTLMERGPRRISPFMIPMMMGNAASGHISIQLGFQGPNFTTMSACASSQHAFGSALDLIRVGRADVVFAGGTESTITRLGVSGFNNLKALSTRNDDPQGASRPFSASRDGFVMGEGAAVFTFEERERAIKRGAKIYCEVTGFGTTDDASHITAPLPEGTQAAASMRGAIADAKLNPTDITYVNAHGTSTPLNDVMETRAIHTAFGDHAKSLMVSSTKSQVGHLLGASGAVELAAIARGIERGVVPPTINYHDPDPECDLDYVPNEAREAPIHHAISNSFGFGGHNATLVVSRHQ